MLAKLFMGEINSLLTIYDMVWKIGYIVSHGLRIYSLKMSICLTYNEIEQLILKGRYL